MYSRAKMEVDFLFCANLLDFSPEKVCDLLDFSPEKVLKSVEKYLYVEIMGFSTIFYIEIL